MQLKHYKDHSKLAEYRPIMPQEARELEHGDSLYYTTGDGVARFLTVDNTFRSRENEPERIEVHCRIGFFEWDTFVANDDGKMTSARALLLRQVEK